MMSETEAEFARFNEFEQAAREYLGINEPPFTVRGESEIQFAYAMWNAATAAHAKQLAAAEAQLQAAESERDELIAFVNSLSYCRIGSGPLAISDGHYVEHYTQHFTPYAAIRQYLESLARQTSGESAAVASSEVGDES